MRIFGGDKLFSVFNSPIFASIPDDEPLAESGMLSKRITSVQKQVEGRNFDIRKHVLEYDDVINQHRLVMYSRRNTLISGDLDLILTDMIDHVSGRITDGARDTLTGSLSLEKLQSAYQTISGRDNLPDISGEEMSGEHELIKTYILSHRKHLESQVGKEKVDEYLKSLMLQSIDLLWMQHIDSMTHLREEVAFEGYAQKNPLIVYRERAYERFIRMIDEIEERIVRNFIASNAPEPVDSATPAVDEQLEGHNTLETLLDEYLVDLESRKDEAIDTAKDDQKDITTIRV